MIRASIGPADDGIQQSATGSVCIYGDGAIVRASAGGSVCLINGNAGIPYGSEAEKNEQEKKRPKDHRTYFHT